MELPTTYTTVQVGMRSLTGDTVTYKINSEPTKEMKSTVDMYYRVALADGGKLVIQNKSDSKQILALTKLKVTGAGTTTNDVSVETTPEAIRYAMALMRGHRRPAVHGRRRGCVVSRLRLRPRLPRCRQRHDRHDLRA